MMVSVQVGNLSFRYSILEKLRIQADVPFDKLRIGGDEICKGERRVSPVAAHPHLLPVHSVLEIKRFRGISGAETFCRKGVFRK